MSDGWKDIVDAAILGVVEGLTEFLPVSSTAHLRLTQQFLGQDLTNGYWKMFAIFIQLGAILSVVVYFWKRLLEFAKAFRWRGLSRTEFVRQPLVLVALSFIVTALPCLLIDKYIGEWLENLWMIATALLVGGVGMGLIDRACGQRATTTKLDAMTLKQAIVIGLSQILAAAFPGTSRSMATIAGGQVMGLDRPTALEFSFFLSIPVMMAASSYKLLQYLKEGEQALGSHEWQVLAVGFGVSFLVAWIVISLFMNWVRKHGFALFALYRIVAGAAILVWLLSGSAGPR